MSYQQTQRQLERQRKAAEKAAKELHQHNRQQEVDQKNRDLEKHQSDLASILEQGLSQAIGPEQLLTYLASTVHIPTVAIQKPRTPHKHHFEARVPLPTTAEKLFGIGKKKRESIKNQIEEDYKRAVVKYNTEKGRYDTQIANRQRALEKRKQITDEFHKRLQEPDAKFIGQYFKLTLDISQYPAFFPMKQIRMAHNPEVKELVVEYDLPSFDTIMPTVKNYRYIKTRDEIQVKELTATDKKKLNALYEKIIAAIALRSLHILFGADHMQALDLVVFNGMIDTVDKSTGRDVRLCLISVQVDKEAFIKLDLTRVDTKACLKHLKAQTSPSSRELVPIKPLVELVTTDDRFIEVDVLSGIDSRTNLLDMSPGDFEHLIANLFSEMGFKTGTTRISRDGGIDVIAFDERPLVGGKIVIQAKRYRNVVGVESVRALYGVMQDEGATKGILVTTSHFGKASREFVKDKPIELMDGNLLLHYLGEHGIEAKIEIPKK